MGAALAAGPAASAPRLDWAQVAAQYDVTPETIQLENGNWGMMARPVLRAYERHLRRVNRETSFYSRRGYGADLERVRTRAATSLGVSPDEIAFTRGATEALQALIGGYNRLRPGDAVLYADHDYDAMQTAMRWLKVRRQVDVISMNLPEPATGDGRGALALAVGNVGDNGSGDPHRIHAAVLIEPPILNGDEGGGNVGGGCARYRRAEHSVPRERRLPDHSGPDR
jgi:hypothetical protein